MTSSQIIVIMWFQFALTTTLLLLLVRFALARLQQPADRIRLIHCTLATAIALPFLMWLTPFSGWRLKLISPLVEYRLGDQRTDFKNIAITAEQNGDWEQSSRQTGNSQLDRFHHASTFEPQFPSAEPKLSSIPRDQSNVESQRVPHAAGGFAALITTTTAILIIVTHGLALLALIVEWAIGSLALRRLCFNFAAAEANVAQAWNQVTQGRARNVRLLISSSIDTPLMFGIFRPVVLVPQNLAAEGGATLKFCLAHEWSHIERSDLVAWYWVWACQCLLWFDPSYWALRKELRLCHDMLADQRATCGAESAVEYSALLVDLARKRITGSVATALMFLDQPKQLTQRVKMLLQQSMPVCPRCHWTFSLFTAVLAVFVAALFSAVRLEVVRAEGLNDDSPTSNEDENSATKGTQSKSDSKEKRPVAQTTQNRPAADTKTPALNSETYTCQVVDKQTGKGVSGARIAVRICASFEQRDRATAVAKYVTDGDGKYVIKFPTEQITNQQDFVEVDVEHDAYAGVQMQDRTFSTTRKNEKVGQRPGFERIELDRGEAVTGTVVSPDGKPLAGVEVSGFSMADRKIADSRTFVETVTDANGRFRINLHQEGDGGIWIVPKDFGIVEKYLARQRGDLGQVRVSAGIRVRGRVLDAKQMPATGIPVNISLSPMARHFGSLPIAGAVMRGAITDAQGQFTLDPLPAGEYRISPNEYRCIAPANDTTRYPLPGVFVARKLVLKEGSLPAPVEIQAIPHIVFHVQNVDGAGKNIRGGNVSLMGELDGESWGNEGRPDQNGSITMWVPRGLRKTFIALALDENVAQQYRHGKGQPLERGNPIPMGTMNNDVPNFEIVNYRAPIILISAVDEQRQPIKSFIVTFSYRLSFTFPPEQTPRMTNKIQFALGGINHQSDGHCRMRQMPPDEEVTFEVKANGYQTKSEKIKLAEGETKELVVMLKKARD
ncbi:MAG: blaR1 3 [Planctomycetaceae bacterium]|nr:blaR1 3 [Planctomycetaceae bacterium]